MELNVNYLDVVNPAVINALAGAGLADTPEQRIKILTGIHDEFAKNPQFGPTVNNGLLLAIENEVKRLEAAND